MLRVATGTAHRPRELREVATRPSLASACTRPGRVKRTDRLGGHDGMMTVRLVRLNDSAAWLGMRLALWPEDPEVEQRKEFDQFFAGEFPRWSRPRRHGVVVRSDAGRMRTLDAMEGA